MEETAQNHRKGRQNNPEEQKLEPEVEEPSKNVWKISELNE